MPRQSAFLMPGRVLSALFRGNLQTALDKAGLLETTPRQAWRRRWVVHVQQAGDGHAVLGYLGRYVHRVALPNSRLESFDGESVTFRYRDNRSQELRRCRLSAIDFLARFLQHVLPRRFVKVRSYGLFASARRADRDSARELLESHSAAKGRAPVASGDPEGPPPNPLEKCAEDPPCRACGKGVLRLVAEIPRSPGLKSTWARAPPPLPTG